jgi:hypothetical protein
MINQKLLEIGNKLNISANEIKNIQKGYITSKILYPIITIIIAIITFILGYFIGHSTCSSGDVYPYISGAFSPLGIKQGKKSKIATLLIAAIGILLAFKLSSVFGQAIKYNVYKK